MRIVVLCITEKPLIRKSSSLHLTTLHFSIQIKNTTGDYKVNPLYPWAREECKNRLKYRSIKHQEQESCVPEVTSDGCRNVPGAARSLQGSAAVVGCGRQTTDSPAKMSSAATGTSLCPSLSSPTLLSTSFKKTRKTAKATVSKPSEQETVFKHHDTQHISASNVTFKVQEREV